MRGSGEWLGVETGDPEEKQQQVFQKMPVNIES